MLGSETPDLPQYEQGGECWDDAAMATSCTAGCQVALQYAEDNIDPLPVECGGDYVVPDVPLQATAVVGANGATLEVLGMTLDIPLAPSPRAPPSRCRTRARRSRAASRARSSRRSSALSPRGWSSACRSPCASTGPEAAGQPVAVYWSLPEAPTSYEPLPTSLV